MISEIFTVLLDEAFFALAMNFIFVGRIKLTQRFWARMFRVQTTNRIQKYTQFRWGEKQLLRNSTSAA